MRLSKSETVKMCRKCKKTKDISEFYQNRSSGDGLCIWCRECGRLAARERYWANPQKSISQTIRWQKNNPERKRETGKRWAINNREKIHANRRKQREQNPEKVREAARRWWIKNPEKTKEYHRRRTSTPKGRLNNTMRSTICRSVIKGAKAKLRWESLVGFTVDQLKRHLEKHFHDGMSWENYGTYWEIDHIIPIAAFNFERPDDIDFRLCWSLKNLRPLESSKNMSKGTRIDKPFQPSLMVAVGGR